MATKRKKIALKESTFEDNQKELIGQKDKAGKQDFLRKVLSDDKMSSQVKWYFSQILDKTNLERKARYTELDTMVKNDSLVSLAVNTIADETVQLGTTDKIITVNSSNKSFVKTYEAKIAKWKLDPKVRMWAKDLAQFGDFINVLDIDQSKKNSEGVREIFPRSPFSLNSRLEFTLAEAKDKIERTYQKSTSINDLLDAVKDISGTVKDTIRMNYKPFLIGFHVDDFILPPWNVLHGRMQTNDPDFSPYGRALIDDSRVPYRTLLTTKMLMTLARLNNFPIEVYSVKTSEKGTEQEKWNAVNETREEVLLQTASGDFSNKDVPSVGQRLFLPQDLLEFDIKENNIDVDEIADAEFFRDDMIMGLRVPKGYLIVDESDYDDADALLYQDTKFARTIYSVQSVILEEITRLIEIDMTATGEYDVDKVQFTVSMPYPVAKVSEDRMSLHSDAIDLITSIIEFFKDTLEIEDIPKDVVFDIISTYSGWDKTQAEKWFNNVWVDGNVGGEGDEEEEKREKVKEAKLKIFNEAVKKVYSEKKNLTEVVNECVIKAYEKNKLSDFVIRGSHHIASSCLSKSNTVKLTEEQQKILEKKLKSGKKASFRETNKKKIKK